MLGLESTTLEKMCLYVIRGLLGTFEPTAPLASETLALQHGRTQNTKPYIACYLVKLSISTIGVDRMSTVQMLLCVADSLLSQDRHLPGALNTPHNLQQNTVEHVLVCDAITSSLSIRPELSASALEPVMLLRSAIALVWWSPGCLGRCFDFNRCHTVFHRRTWIIPAFVCEDRCPCMARSLRRACIGLCCRC